MRTIEPESCSIPAPSFTSCVILRQLIYFCFSSIFNKMRVIKALVHWVFMKHVNTYKVLSV